MYSIGNTVNDIVTTQLCTRTDDSQIFHNQFLMYTNVEALMLYT